MIHEEEVYRIGQLKKPHGVRGEINFAFTTDVWDRVEADYLVLRVEGILVPFFLDEYRFRTDETALVKFDGIDTLDDVLPLVGLEVFFPRALTPEDEEEAPSLDFFVGFRLTDTVHGPLGPIVAVDTSTPNPLFVVDTPQGELLVPAQSTMVREVDQQARVLTMELPEGLL